MANGHLTKTEFQEMKESERQFYIWERLNMIVGLKNEVAKIKNWQSKMIGAMIVLNVIVLPLMFIIISKYV